MPLMVNGVQVDLTAKNDASPVIKQVAADINGLEVQNNSLSTSSKNASSELGGMEISAAALGQSVSIVTVGVGAMVAAFKFGEIAAGNERLIESGQHLAESYGESLDNIVAKVKEASLGTVSDMDIIASANKAMMLGVGGDAEQLAKLMEIAAFRGRAMGITTAQAFDDMARGIGRMSPMILDNLGIIVDAKTTYGNYAESIGKSASELTRAEKIQALLNKVLEEGNKQLDDAGGLVEDNATKYERFNAELENTKNYLLENTIQMSRFADMGGDLMVSFRNLADNGIGYGNDKLNLWSLFLDFGASRVANMKEEIASQTDSAIVSYTAWAQSIEATAQNMQDLAGVEVEVVAVDADAVKGAMQVHDTYQKLGEKMTDLQVDHDELLAKKQELINKGWWPESEKIKDVNDKLADNEQKQKDVTLAMQGTLAQMLLNTAAAGLDAEGQLALARATGQIDEATFAALTAQGLLKKQYEDGVITAAEYAKKTLELRDAVNQLKNRDITITVTTIEQGIRLNRIDELSNIKGEGFAEGGISTGPTSGHMELLHGTEAVIPLSNGSIPVQIQAPAGGMNGGSSVQVYLTIQSAVSIASEEQARTVIFPFIEDGIRRMQAEGRL